MEKAYYEELKKMNDTEVRFKLSQALINQPNQNKDAATIYRESIGIAYVLLLTQNYTEIDASSYDTFILSSNFAEEKKDIVTRYVKDNWNIVSEFLNQFSNRQLQYFILFQNTEENFRYTPVPVTPEGISRLAGEILNIQAGDTVVDLCSGLGNFLMEIFSQYPEAKMTGIEIDKTIRDISMIRSDVLNGKFSIQVADALEYRLPEKVDKLFSNYPFALKLLAGNACRKKVQEAFYMEESVIQKASTDWLFNAVLVEQMKETGRAVAIMPNGCTTNSRDKLIRKFFVEKGYVEAVILLPDKIFSDTTIFTSMIVFSMGNKAVKLVDARDLCEKDGRHNRISSQNIKDILFLLENDSEKSITKSIKELEENEFVLNATRYLDFVELKNGVVLKDVAKSIIRGKQLNSEKMDTYKTGIKTSCRYLVLPNINDGTVDFNEKEIFLKEIPEKMQKYCVKNNSIVLSKVSATGFKSAIVKVHEGETILTDGNLILIELDEEKADPYFVQSFLDSSAGAAALNRICTGTGLPTISLANLEKLVIPLPPLTEQKAIGQKYAAEMDKIAWLKQDLEQTRQRMKHIYDANI